MKKGRSPYQESVCKEAARSVVGLPSLEHNLHLHFAA